MKLYTEEQVKMAIKLYNETSYSYSEAYQKLTPIELPSDEEIRKESMEFYDNNGADIYFIQGAKWVIEQIKEQNNGTSMDKK